METPLLMTSYASQAAPFMVPTVILMAIIYIWTHTMSSKPINLPDLGNTKKEFLESAPELLRSGYKKYSAWRMQTVIGDTVFLCRENMTDFLKRPDNPVEFQQNVEFDFQAKYTGFNAADTKLPHVLRDNLTATGIPRFIGRLAAAADDLVKEFFLHNTDWTELKLMPALNNIVSIAVGNILIGPELSRSDEWITGSKKYATTAFKAAYNLREWPALLRPFVCLSMPTVKLLKEAKQEMAVVLDPVMEERRRRAKESGGAQNKPDDCVQWYEDHPMESQLRPSELVLGVGLAAVNSTLNITVEALLDLAAMPQYQEPLRAEVEAAFAKNNGVWTKDALYSCQLLDSFLKESHRMRPDSYSFGKRIILTDFQLRDGTVIPKGTLVCCPVEAVTHDPAFYENPDQFDGFRHYRVRQQGGYAVDKHQWTTTHQAALGFGYGKHSCPGRFFAAVAIKLIFASILMNYDLALPAGQGRPRSIVRGDRGAPDPEARIILRKRAAL